MIIWWRTSVTSNFAKIPCPDLQLGTRSRNFPHIHLVPLLLMADAWPTRLASATQWQQVIEAVLLPLALVHALPAQYNQLAKDAPTDPHWISTWWSTCQHTLLTVTLVTWAPGLHEHNLYETVLDGWFIPSNASTVWVYTLQTCSALLRGRVDCHPATLDALYYVLTRLDSSTLLRHMLEAVHSEPHAARRDILWDDAVANVSALPTRVANVFGPHRDRKSLLDMYGTWLGDMSAGIHDAIEIDPSRIARLLTRFARTGALLQRVPPTWWDQMLPHIQSSLESTTTIASHAKNAWHAMYDACDPSTQEVLALSLAYALNARLNSTSYAWPVAQQERAPGTEGRAFLTTEAWRWAYTAYLVLQTVLGTAEAPRLPLVHVDKAHAHTEWTPLFSIALAAWACDADARTSLQELIHVWSHPQHIAHASYTHAQSITLMVLMAIRITHENKTALTTHAQSMEFLQGVSAYLEHTDARIRRLGMLVAEILSQATNEAPLKFPAEVWDGRGDGRGVCRVLRAAYERQGPFWPDTRPFPWRDESTRLLQQMQSLSTKGTNAFAQRIAAEEAPRPRRRSSPPTLRLPRRVPARVLIEEVHPQEGARASPRTERNASSLNGLYIYDEESSDSDASDVGADMSARVDSGVRTGDAVEEEDPYDPQDSSTMLGDALRKKPRVPVYIYELAPLARERDYEANKCVLKHAESLIRRKTGWGYEIAEHAVDLATALASMQDTYELRDFDLKRTRALSALCVAAPMPVVDALYEQFFSPHYSLAQRLSMLRAVAAAAMELSRDGSSSGSAATAPLPDTTEMAGRLVGAAMSRMQQTGEARIAASYASDMARVRSASMKDVPFAPAWSVRPTVPFTAVASSSFIFPLIRRLDHARQTASRMYAGSDTTLTPNSTSAVLYTLCVLCWCGRNAAFFPTRALPEVLGVVDVWSSDSSNHADVWTASMALALVLLDIAVEHDGGLHLVRSHAPMLLRLQAVAQASLDTSPQAAAVVLCITDMQERTRGAFLRT